MSENKAFLSAFSLGWELGYTIAVPLVFFAIAGRLADKYFNTSPLLLLGGIIFSIFFTSFLLYKKIKKIFQEQNSK